MPDKTKTKIDEKIQPFREIDKEAKSREDLIDDFILALDSSDLDSETAIKYLRRRSIAIILLLITGVILIAAAAFIILVPLPKYLEIKTLFYFNPNDGITVSDIFGLILLFSGIVLTVTGMSLRKKL